ncbi:DUF4157 domain-containing protein [Plantactinospora sp. B6F1]|uniref:eCIS core domain-containing protein n=1 Tax=Plantactinospora sp. B6F1 TaxID=3158971 RepID=UPI0032D99DBC
MSSFQQRLRSNVLVGADAIPGLAQRFLVEVLRDHFVARLAGLRATGVALKALMDWSNPEENLMGACSPSWGGSMHAHDQPGARQRPTPPGRTVHRADADRLSPAHPADPGRLLALQRLAGNSAVGRLVASWTGGSVQRDQSHDPAADATRASVDAVVRSAGEPLAPAVRADMEAVTGHDQSAVRIHRDAAAHHAAKSLGANAFTTGTHIAFQQGRYDPTSGEGRRMLRHELEHVNQQSRGSVEGTDMGNGISVSHPSDRHERAAVKAADSMPAQRVVDGTAPATEPAVPAQRIAVQRDVGFEFEAGGNETSTSVYNTPITTADLAGVGDIPTYDNPPSSSSSDALPTDAELGPLGDVPPPARQGPPPRGRTTQFEPRHPPAEHDRMRALRKHERILTGQGFHVEADESLAGSDLEFVVGHVPETDAGREQLVQVMNNILAIANLLVPEGIHRATDVAVGGTTAASFTGGYAVVGRVGQLGAKPQVTAGLRLDRLDELMGYIANPVPSGQPAPTVASAANAQQRAFVDLNSMDDINRIMNKTVAHTAAAIASLRARPDVPNDFGSPELRGLLNLVVSYLIEAGRGVSMPFAKSIAPMLARTDLAAIFQTLPPAEKTFLSAEYGQEFVDLVFSGGRIGGGPDEPVIKGGISQANRPARAFDHVTRDLWLRELTDSTDILSPHGYQEIFPEPEVGQARYTDLESMGAFGERMDRVGPSADLRAPILELRRMRDLAHVAEWPTVALAVFDLVRALNANEALNYDPSYVAPPAPAPSAPSGPPSGPPTGGPAPGHDSDPPPKTGKRQRFKESWKKRFG